MSMYFYFSEKTTYTAYWMWCGVVCGAILLGRCHMLVCILLDDYRNNYFDLEIKLKLFCYVYLF